MASPERPARHLSLMMQTGATSLFATLVDWLVYVGLVELFGVYYVVAATFTHLLGLVLIFAMNRRWVFHAEGAVLPQFLRFAGANLFGGALVIGLLYLSVDGVGIPYWAGLAVANLVVFVAWTYPSNRWFVFPTAPAAAADGRPAHRTER